MKKLEKLVTDPESEAPKKHYVNMDLNGNIKDQAPGSGAPASAGQSGIEGRGGLQSGASDTLPAVSGQKQLGQKNLQIPSTLKMTPNQNLWTAPNHLGSNSTQSRTGILQKSKAGLSRQVGNDSAILPGHTGIRIQNQSPNRVQTEIRALQARDQGTSLSNGSGKMADHLHQQDSILLNSTLNRNDSNFAQPHGKSSNQGNAFLVGVTAATHGTSQDTLLEDIPTKRTRQGGGLQTNEASMETDEFNNSSQAIGGTTLKKATQNSIFSELESAEQVKNQLTLMQKKITDHKVDNSRNIGPTGAFGFEHHTTSDQRNFYGNYSQKNQKYFSKQSGYNNKGKKQDMQATNYSRVNFALETDSALRGQQVKGNTSLPRIQLTRGAVGSSTQDSLLKNDYDPQRAASLVNANKTSHAQFSMGNSHYQNVPLKKKPKNDLYNSVQRKQVNSIIDYNQQSASKQVMGKTTKQASPTKDDPLQVQSFFGLHSVGMGVSAGLGRQNLRDTLLTTRQRSTDGLPTQEGKPVLTVSKTDLDKLLKGKTASTKFIEQNRKEIQKYMSTAMKSEENMLGYLEFSNATMHGLANANNIYSTDQEAGYDNNQNNISMYDQTANATARDPIGGMDSIHSEYKTVEEARKVTEEIQSDLPKHNNSKIQRLLAKSAPKNHVLEAHGVTNKVIEKWLNETLSDAEHLDIPGVILKPEHKNPISRYGIDRLELNNNGIPAEMIDRIYRCLFVYSVGFYELISKVIQHSNQKYTLITRIWKVFAVILEYCCLTDYKMMITQITNEHEEMLAEKQKEFDEKCEQYVEHERYLKSNIQVLTSSNQELERDRTNERALRLKLEEEYMQNTKNHEEEVQLRLKFESKLNSMHSQQRETDVKYNRAVNELDQANLTIKNAQIKIKEQNTKLLDNQTLIEEQRERLSILEEHKIVWEKEVKNKAAQMTQLEDRMKTNQEETNHTRFQMSKVSNDNSKASLQIEMMETKIATFENLRATLEAQLKDTLQSKSAYQEQAKELKLQSDEQLIQLNECVQKLALAEESLTQKENQYELQSIALRQHTAAVEELAVTKRNQSAEIETLKERYARLQIDFQDSAEKLHQVNRYRHELELQIQSEKLLNEKQHALMLDKEDEIYQLKDDNYTLTQTIMYREQTIKKLETEITELGEQIADLKIRHRDELNEVREHLADARAQLGEWVDKFRKSEGSLQLSKEAEKFMTKQINELCKTRDSLLEQNDAQRGQLKAADDAADLAKQIHEKTVFDHNCKVKALEEQLSTAREEIVLLTRKLENQIAEFAQATLENETLTEEKKLGEEKLSEALHKLFYDGERHKAYISVSEEVEAESQLEIERLSMQTEDYHKQFFNAVNFAQLKEFGIMELESKIRADKIRENLKSQQFEQDLDRQVQTNTDLGNQVEFLTQELNDLQAQLDAARNKSLRETKQSSKLDSARNLKSVHSKEGKKDVKVAISPSKIDEAAQDSETDKNQDAINQAREQKREEKMNKHLAKKKVNTCKIRHIDCQTDFPKSEPITQVVYVNVGGEKDGDQPVPKEFQSRSTQMSPARAQEVRTQTPTVTHQKKVSDYQPAEPEQTSVKLLSDMRQQQERAPSGNATPLKPEQLQPEESFDPKFKQGGRQLPSQTLLKGSRNLKQEIENKKVIDSSSRHTNQSRISGNEQHFVDPQQKLQVPPLVYNSDLQNVKSEQYQSYSSQLSAELRQEQNVPAAARQPAAVQHLQNQRVQKENHTASAPVQYLQETDTPSFEQNAPYQQQPPSQMADQRHVQAQHQVPANQTRQLAAADQQLQQNKQRQYNHSNTNIPNQVKVDYRHISQDDQSPERTESNIYASRSPGMTTAVYPKNQKLATSVTQSYNSAAQQKASENNNIEESQINRTATTVEQFEVSSIGEAKSTTQKQQMPSMMQTKSKMQKPIVPQQMNQPQQQQYPQQIKQQQNIQQYQNQKTNISRVNQHQPVIGSQIQQSQNPNLIEYHEQEPLNQSVITNAQNTLVIQQEPQNISMESIFQNYPDPMAPDPNKQIIKIQEEAKEQKRKQQNNKMKALISGALSRPRQASKQ